MTIRLEDVTAVDGSTRLLVIVAGGQEEGRYEEVWSYDVSSGAAFPIYRTEASEGGIARASLQGDVLVITRTAEGLTWFEFLDATGEPIAVANPKRADAELPVFVDQGVLSPDGATLAYLESDTLSPEDGSRRIDLVIYSLDAGIENRRIEIDLGDWHPGRMDYDGTGLALGREQSTGDGWVAATRCGSKPSAPMSAASRRSGRPARRA